MNLSNSHTYEPVCPVCSSKLAWTISFFDHRTSTVVRRGSGYHWRLCQVCGNGFPSVAPTLTELQQYWNANRIDEAEAPVTPEVWSRRVAASQLWAQLSYDFVMPFVGSDSRKFLDVACGLGETVSLFQKRGWQAEGVDADPGTKVFHDRLGIQSTIGQVENVGTSTRYDLISIAHAIYFITEPRLFVQRVRGILNDGGLFMVVFSQLLSSLTPSRPAYVHTWYPTAYSLTYLLEQEGFEILNCRHVKGSIIVVARKSVSREPQTQAYRAYWAHLSHGWRYRLIGKPLLAVASLRKRLRGRI